MTKARISLSKYFMGDSTEESDELLEVPFFPEGVPHASVCFSGEISRQIRQYEPMKVFCSVSLPCLAHEDEIKAALAKAKDLVDEQLTIAHKEISEVIAEMRSK